MRWTTVCDLRFQEYGPSVAIDSSRFLNHASIGGGVAPHDGYVRMTNSAAELVLRVLGDSLQRFSGLQVFADILPTAVGRRQNVVEGWMSFAFYIQPDGQLVATIYDGHTWAPVTGAPGDVPFDQWSHVSFQYDGISRGVLTVNGHQVGISTQMPLGIRQPYQNITIGHWPSGDGRYTFQGDIGRVLLRRRDYEDMFQDSVDAMLCNRKLTEFQMAAMAELRQRLQLLTPEMVERLRACARAQYDVVTAFMRDLTLDTDESFAVWRRWRGRLLKAWCCGPDPLEVRVLTQELISTLGPPQRDRLKRFVEEYKQAGASCDGNQMPLARIRELLYIVVPELVYLDEQVPPLMATL